MTGAPSTKPPAVIGRDCASFTAARGVPVLMPLGCWRGVFSGCVWARAPIEKKMLVAKVQRMVPTTLPRKSVLGREECGVESSRGKGTQANFLTRDDALQSRHLCARESLPSYISTTTIVRQ